MEIDDFLRDLKIAVVERDPKAIAGLYELMPDFSNGKLSLETLQAIEPLLKEAIEILKESASILRRQMDYTKAVGVYQASNLS